MTNNNEKTDDNKSRVKSVLMLIVLAIVVFAVFFSAIKFIGSRNSEDVKKPSVTTTAPTNNPQEDNSAQGGDSESTGRGDDGNRESSSINTNKPVAPTTPRYSGGADHASPIDPSTGTPDFLGEHAIQQVFSMKVTPNSSWSSNFDKISSSFATPQLQKKGFVKWYEGNNNHNAAWPMDDGMTKFVAFADRSNGKLISNDTYVVTVTVNQRMKTERPKGYSNLPEFKVQATMKYINGKWLLDNWTYTKGTPNIH